jgi:hypothetical protein
MGRSDVANSGLASIQMASLATSPAYAGDRAPAGTYGGGVFKSANGASSWSAAAPAWPTSTCSLDLSPNYASDQTVFAGAVLGIFRSTNGGNSWERLAMG